MLRLSVNINDVAARKGIAATIEALENREEIHQAIGGAVETKVADHLRGLNSRSPNTSFYGRAGRTAADGDGPPSVATVATAEKAEVSISHRGIALRYYGGRVLPVNVENLALPTEHVPLSDGREGRKRPREMGILAFIPNRGGPNVTTGYLVEGEEKTITRGPRKGGKRTVPKEGGKMMYVLRGWTDHAADESVLPTVAELLGAAENGATDYLESFQPLT